MAAYAGELFLWDEHMARLAAGLRALEIPFDGLPALRAARCDLKTLSLTANVLAKEAAVRAEAYEACWCATGR